ncbi:MAG: hypothetical protein MJE77_39935 [Proteobacteria bacterium]|nr:hypothetical protein [Pseudomonadota bacterium]
MMSSHLLLVYSLAWAIVVAALIGASGCRNTLSADIQGAESSNRDHPRGVENIAKAVDYETNSGHADVLLHRSECGPVTALWYGEELEPRFPREYGVNELRFAFASARGQQYPLKTRGVLHFSDWSFDVFAPGCRHVLLLQDRFGPYHVVEVDALKEYLLGQRAPYKVIQENHSTALVHFDARWLSASEFEFKAGGDPPVHVRHRLP